MAHVSTVTCGILPWGCVKLIDRIVQRQRVAPVLLESTKTQGDNLFVRIALMESIRMRKARVGATPAQLVILPLIRVQDVCTFIVNLGLVVMNIIILDGFCFPNSWEKKMGL